MDYYKSGNITGYESYQDHEINLRIVFRRFLRKMSDMGLAGGGLLEVSCCFGYFLDETRGFFKRRVGIDMLKEAIENDREVTDKVHP